LKLTRVSAVWCRSCMVTNSIWKQLQIENPDMTYCEIDYDIDALPYAIG